MSTKHACILHVGGGKSGDGDDVKRFDKQSWQRVKYAEKARKLMKSSKYFAVKLPEKYDDSFGYNTKCYKDYTAFRQRSKGPCGLERQSRVKKPFLRSNINEESQPTTSTVYLPNCVYFVNHYPNLKGKVSVNIWAAA